MCRVVAIGVGDQVDFDELRTIATTPCDVHTVEGFDHMDDDMDETMDQICGCQSNTAQCQPTFQSQT